MLHMFSAEGITASFAARGGVLQQVVGEVAAEIRAELGQDQDGLAEPPASRRQTK